MNSNTTDMYFQTKGYLVDGAPTNADQKQWLVRLDSANGEIVHGPINGQDGFYSCRKFINKSPGFIFSRNMENN